MLHWVRILLSLAVISAIPLPHEARSINYFANSPQFFSEERVTNQLVGKSHPIQIAYPAYSGEPIRRKYCVEVQGEIPPAPVVSYQPETPPVLPPLGWNVNHLIEPNGRSINNLYVDAHRAPVPIAGPQVWKGCSGC
ncbi:uncharacterized protein [Fopius arisanus]|uniref:Uncharacterized protein isoform X2 n=1 Tax=Fopius arisanus TaxID=64838 RepID=A0A9R1U3U9_9HYME|nr:PREDICTED: uncharacterized protein LOC105269141 isoform X2 [Fopius arisanus]